MSEFENQVVLVTGGESGIGSAIVREFVGSGAQVHVIGLDAALLEQLAEELGQDRVSTFVADVSRSDDVKSGVHAALSRWGRIDVVISNAGIGGTPAAVEDYDTSVFAAVLGVHVTGAFNVMRAVLPHLRRGGNIVVTASTAGLRGYPQMSAYVAAKHAQVGLVKAVALEVAARGIRVNAIAPGPTSTRLQDEYAQTALNVPVDVATDMISSGIPLGRYNTPAEIAAAVAFLASNRAASVTGTVLVVDGGALA